MILDGNARHPVFENPSLIKIVHKCLSDTFLALRYLIRVNCSLDTRSDLRNKHGPACASPPKNITCFSSSGFIAATVEMGSLRFFRR